MVGCFFGPGRQVPHRVLKRRLENGAFCEDIKQGSLNREPIFGEEETSSKCLVILTNVPSVYSAVIYICQSTTLPETNIAPEHGWLEDEISFWDGLLARCYV